VTTRRALLQAALLLPALGWRGAARAQGAPLVFLGDRDLPPYEFLDGEVPRGANVELAQAIGRVLGRRVEVRLMGWAEAQRRLLAGEGDALTMLGRSEQREAQFDFSLPTMPAPFAFFVPADQERLFVARSRFGGVRVAVTQGGLAAELLAASHPEAERVEVANLNEGIDRLRLGTVDALAGNSWSVRSLLVQRGISGIGELPPFARRRANMAVRKGDAATLGRIDRALSVLKTTGEFDAILDRWSGTAAYLVPDWVVRTALATGATAAVALAGLGWQALRLRARSARLLRRGRPGRQPGTPGPGLRRRRAWGVGRGHAQPRRHREPRVPRAAWPAARGGGAAARGVARLHPPGGPGAPGGPVGCDHPHRRRL
jgi:polar amino acid transport system substrate-binding protein